MSLSSNPTKKTSDTIQNAIQKAEEIIDQLLEERMIPGIAVNVSQNEHSIWQQGYGYADLTKKTPIDPKHTLFRIASVSKPIAATGLAKMIENNIIDINASLYDYVSYFPKKAYDISIKQLGTHLSGIRGYKGKELIFNHTWSIKKGIDLFKNDALLFAPGTHYAYSSYNWNLIALAIEETAGMPFETYIRKNVLKPLQMHNTIAPKQDTSLPKATLYTRNHKKEFKIAPSVNNTYKLASGGYLSTSDDIIKLGTAYLQANFIPKAITEIFLTAQKVNNKSTNYGIGWEVGFDHKGRPFYGHVGNGIGCYAFFRVYPSQHIIFSILMNSFHSKINTIIPDIVDHFISNTISAL